MASSGIAGVTFATPLGLIAVLAPIVAVLVWLRSPPPLGILRSRIALGLRLVILSLVVLALGGLSITTDPSSRTTVAVVDRSASTVMSADQGRTAVRRLIDGLPPADQLGVVTFGRQPQVELSPTRTPSFTDSATAPDPNYTNIERALRLAGALMPADSRHQVVVVSDGRQNIGDDIAQARLLRSQGVRVDVVPLQLTSGPEVRIDAVRIPSTVPLSAHPHATVAIVSNVDTSVLLRVAFDHGPADQRTIDVKAGETDADFALPAVAAGFHTVEATIEPARDTLVQNNIGEAVFQVPARRQVLVVEGSAGEGANVAGALKAASVDVQVVAPDQVSPVGQQLAQYQGVVLVDVPARELGAERMKAVQTAVRDFGVGLSAFGGSNTFGPGGLQGTPLEAALPIDMNVSEKAPKPRLAVILVLETMESAQADAVMRGAAQAVVQHLRPTDLVGVAAGVLPGLLVPLQTVGDGSAVSAAIGGLNFPDGAYSPGLQAAGDALAGQQGVTRHVILLGDGDEGEDHLPVVDAAVRRGITVSAVGIDVHHMPADMATIQSTAEHGKGRFYESGDPSQVPDFFLQETQKAFRPWLVDKRFQPAPSGQAGVFSGIDISSLPPLDGYVAATPKAAAEVLLSGPQTDPILARWQYGVGTSAAWTSDTQGRWTSDLLAWPGAARLLANIVESTFPAATDPAIALQTSLVGDQGHVTVQVQDAPADATATATVVGPDLLALDLPLQATGPGRFETDFNTDQVGSYVVHVTVSGKGRAPRSATAGLAAAYSPEYRLGGTDSAALQELAAAGGGRVITDAAAAFGLEVPPTEVRQPLTFALLAISLLLLPIDVASRRLMFRRGEQLWDGLLRRRRATHVPAGDARPSVRAASAPPPTAAVEQPGSEPPRPVEAAHDDETLAARLLEKRRGRR